MQSRKLKEMLFAVESYGLAAFSIVNLFAVPLTYGYLLYAAENWTLLNAVPRVLGYFFMSLGWFMYWPLELLWP